MAEYECEKCGAIYTSESNRIPSEMSCTCENRNFKLIEKELN